MGSFHHNTQIENESKVAQEESSETQEKAPQDACEIQVNNSQHPDLGHFTYRTNTMTHNLHVYAISRINFYAFFNTPDHTHSLGLPLSTMAAGMFKDRAA